jgi:hypothetical protein
MVFGHDTETILQTATEQYMIYELAIRSLSEAYRTTEK